MMDKFFFLLSCGVANGAVVRARTQSIFMLFTFFTLIAIEFCLFDVLNLSRNVGATLLVLSLPLPWVLSRFIDPYVDRKWHLFGPVSKEGLPYLWAYRAAAYGLLIILLITVGICGSGWSKENI